MLTNHLVRDLDDHDFSVLHTRNTQNGLVGVACVNPLHKKISLPGELIFKTSQVWRNLFILYFVFVKKQRTIERKKKRSKISALESCYAYRIYGTFGVEMRAYGQKLVKFCTQTHRRVNSSKDTHYRGSKIPKICIGKEWFVVVVGLAKFHKYIRGRPFLILT